MIFRKWEGFLFIVPYLAGIILFFLLPTGYAFVLSFTNWNFFKELQFVGIRNYLTIFRDNIFFSSMRITLYYTLLTVPSLAILSLLLAVLVNRKIPFIKSFRTIFFVPGILSAAAIASAWAFILNKDFGLLNQYLGLLGKVNWLGDARYVVPAMAIICVWQQVSYNFVLYLAALQNIPENLIEAATIDGAGTVKRFFYLTVPLVSPTIFMVVFTTMIFQLQQFTYSQILLGGRFGSKTVTFYIYEMGFKANEMGYGAAISILFFAIIFVIMLLLWLSQKKWVFYTN